MSECMVCGEPEEFRIDMDVLWQDTKSLWPPFGSNPPAWLCGLPVVFTDRVSKMTDEEWVILLGDPNIPKPQGVINASD